MRGLIVDDAKSMRIFLGKILSEFGFEVLEAGDGCGALDRLMEIGKVDLVVVDWRMPEPVKPLLTLRELFKTQ